MMLTGDMECRSRGATFKVVVPDVHFAVSIVFDHAKFVMQVFRGP